MGWGVQSVLPIFVLSRDSVGYLLVLHLSAWMHAKDSIKTLAVEVVSEPSAMVCKPLTQPSMHHATSGLPWHIVWLDDFCCSIQQPLSLRHVDSPERKVWTHMHCTRKLVGSVDGAGLFGKTICDGGDWASSNRAFSQHVTPKILPRTSIPSVTISPRLILIQKSLRNATMIWQHLEKRKLSVTTNHVYSTHN